jgi:hypothetical protein
MKSLITHRALIDVGSLKTKALVVAEKQDEDHG